MFERQHTNETYLCPQCKQQLIRHEAEFVCPEHGVFFVYGSNLLVRAPRKDDNKSDTLLPWEKPATA